MKPVSGPDFSHQATSIRFVPAADSAITAGQRRGFRMGGARKVLLPHKADASRGGGREANRSSLPVTTEENPQRAPRTKAGLEAWLGPGTLYHRSVSVSYFT